MDRIELLLARADDGEPVLPEGLAAESLSDPPRPGDGLDATGHLGDPAADPQDLAAQRWGVVAPEGPDGERLLRWIAPLMRHREAQQGAPVRVLRAPPGLDAAGALAWRDQVYAPQHVPTLELPRYLLFLGDLDLLSLDLQQVLGVDAYCGRLAWPAESSFAAYVEKLLRWEQRRVPAAGVTFHTVHDGTSATSATYRGLVKPALSQLQADQEAGRVQLERLRDEGDIFDPDPRALLDGAKAEAQVTLTVCHGQGAPRGGWASAAAQRERQGALVFGGGCTVGAQDLASAPFLPGGLWFAMACFGAGTPARSLYYPWLLRLREAGGYSGQARAVLADLPQPGAPGFLSALPLAALANPEGPLGVIGHVDLAWTFGFQDEQGDSRASRFSDALRALAQGRRLGTAFHRLYSHFGLSNLALSVDYDREEQARALSQAWTADPRRRARLWMQRQDLGGFVLLGDPAARLPIGTTEPPAPRTPELFTTADPPEPASAAQSAPEPALSPLPEPAPMPSGEAVDWVREALVARIREAAEVEIEEIFETHEGHATLARRLIRLRGPPR